MVTLATSSIAASAMALLVSPSIAYLDSSSSTNCRTSTYKMCVQTQQNISNTSFRAKDVSSNSQHVSLKDESAVKTSGLGGEVCVSSLSITLIFKVTLVTISINGSLMVNELLMKALKCD